MSKIDWPLAILLAVMFVVMSVLRWRYFTSKARRWNQPAKPAAPATPPERDPNDEDRR